ncbi:hypothetical protein LF1_50870 [Rubripirellula obstinata]|uniref:Uncharacterized protein n=1 Tax=Rubripirellula obstinata TaxID=406547 RepID=A0A5B1CQ52_9BACT|nr:hypothetical protein [Rubripirellula obstinata]KAA1262522.1 hypothetical protein LF1_50870 [Rubripirellula obstinata]
MTAEEVPDQIPTKVHAGYQLESGLLGRVRDWIDLFGPLRLVRVMRISVSPIALFVVAAVYLVWQFGFVTFLHPKVHWGGIGNPVYDDLALVGFSFNPTSLWFVFNRPDPWASFLLVSWSLVLWTPVALYLARQGGLLTADRTMEDVGSLLKRSLRRTPSAWLTAIVPTLCSAAIGLMVMLLSLLLQLSHGLFFLEWPLAIAITCISIPIGLLLFGSFVATPLAMASISNERQADPLDSLSRGYEALYRRPLHLIFSTLTAIVLVAVVWLITSGVSGLASVSAGLFTDITGTSRDQQLLIQHCIAELPTIVALTTWLAMVGGIYLLARHDTGGQEVEDLWMPEKPTPPPMPQPSR